MSVADAFAMARAGAHGETARQLDRVFGFPATGTDEAFNAITRPLPYLANCIFVDHDQAVEPAYLHTLAEHYGAGVRQVSFSSGQANKAIDAWVSEQTHGRIQRLFDHLDPKTRLALANAVYLKALWQHPFPGVTDAPFTTAAGPVQVPTMALEEDLRYAAGDGWQAVELPYEGGRLAMWVLVPDRTGDPDRLLSPEVFHAVGSALHQSYLRFSMPRWDFHTDLDLVPVLKGLGLTAPFSLGADFSGIAPGLYIAQAEHRASITVDTSGTEAAAVTGIAMQSSARIEPPLEVRADHPFAFAIVDVSTRIPLFTGHVANPVG
jgi:serpin B